MWPALDGLRAQWFELTAVLPQSAAADQVFNDLAARYTEDGRTYHNLNHIQTMLQIAHDYQHLAEDWTAVCLAIWYHDAVYVPGAPDNERLSAELAAHDCAAFGLPPNQIEKIEALILATKLDAAVEQDVDSCLLLDADLAILGAEPRRYAAYARGVRQEFAFVSDADFRRGRAVVLNSFLQRERIYLLAECFQRFESVARKNIQQELNTL